MTPRSTAVFTALLCLVALARASHGAPDSLYRELVQAQPHPQQAVVPWLIGILLILLTSLVLFKKSKRAGYQDR
jgi:hypothetical protein